MKAPEPSPTPLRRLLRSLNTGSLGVTTGFTFTAALLLSPIFEVSFGVLLGRTLFVALLPLVFTVLLLVYLAAVGGRPQAFFSSGPRLTGFLIITITALLLGLLIALTAQRRGREVRARTLELQVQLRQSRLEKQSVDAQPALLQAQIEPHFLFNTLANVQALMETNSPRAAPVLRSLQAYLRAAMPRLHRGQSTLGDEHGLVRAYLELMQMRMPDRLQFSMDVGPALSSMAFPAMALVPAWTCWRPRRKACAPRSTCPACNDAAMTTTALIANDEPLLREHLRLQLATLWPELQVVAEARNGREAIELFDEHAPPSPSWTCTCRASTAWRWHAPSTAAHTWSLSPRRTSTQCRPLSRVRWTTWSNPSTRTAWL